MENNKNKSLWIILIVVLVIVAGSILWSMVGSKVTPAVSTSGTEDKGINTPLNSTEDTSAGSVNVDTPSATISYASASVKYKDALLQFDKTCKGNPSNLTFKNNTNIMLDNRSPVDRVVKVGSPMNIKAYSFKIVKLQSATLPATWPVDCDLVPNVATIVIQ